jgi:cation diffusion facilitator CzcD-associated flavoprotein CzcO
MDKYKKPLIHTARWPDNLDLKGKRVAVIGGSGATGVQLVPAIQPQVEKLVVYLRSPFWTVPGVGSRKFAGPEAKNFNYTPEQMQKLRDNPDLLRQYQEELEDDLTWVFKGVCLT